MQRETTTPDASATSGGSAPVDTNFTMAYHSEVMVSWDPSDSYSNEVIAMQNMYETLTRYDSETQEVVPLLATSWESKRDGKWSGRSRSATTSSRSTRVAR